MTKLKITAISDLHGYYPELPGGDLLIMAGDYTGRGTEEEWEQFYDYIDLKNYKKIIIISGNHDSVTFTDGLTSIGLTSIMINDIELTIFRSPWTLTFLGINPLCNHWTIKDEAEMTDKLKDIPEGIDILVTHGPPYGILDKTIDGQYVGSKALWEAVGRIKPLVHIFGHIHECGGKRVVRTWDNGHGSKTIFYNVAMVDHRYQPRDFIRNFEIEISKKVVE